MDDWKAPSRMACKVVIVDDNDILLENYVDVVRHAGIDVVGCTTVEDAKIQIRGSCPSVVVVDLSLDYKPDAGHELCVWIQQVASTVAVLVHTSSEAQADRDRAIAAGVVDYLVKTSDLDPFLDRVKTLCGQKFSSAPLSPMRFIEP